MPHSPTIPSTRPPPPQSPHAKHRRSQTPEPQIPKSQPQVEVDAKNGVYAELKEGAYLGETCVLGISDTRPVTVRAINWCNLFCLTMESLEECLARHPEAQVHFMQLAVSATAEKAVRGAIEKLEELRREESAAASGAPSPTKTPKTGLSGSIGAYLNSTESSSLAGGSRRASAQADGGEGEGVGYASATWRRNSGLSTIRHVEPPVVVRALRRTKKVQTAYNTARTLFKGDAADDAGGDGAGGAASRELSSRSGEFAANALREYLGQVAKSKGKVAAKKAAMHKGIEALEVRIESMIKECTVLKEMIEKEL